ncbi:hypothetical protein D3C72_1856080 [compost metagenome]
MPHLAGTARVIDRLAEAPRRVQQFFIALELRAGHELGNDVRRQRRGGGDFSGHAQGGDCRLLVARVGQVIRVDARIGEWIGGLDRHVAAAVRAQLAHGRGKGGKRMRAFARLVGAQRLHVELDVGPLHFGRRLGKHRHLAGRQGQRP